MLLIKDECAWFESEGKELLVEIKNDDYYEEMEERFE
jgi:hypothetical protein